MRKKLNRMRGREITEFGDLGSRVAELYSPFLTLTGGNYQNPLVLRQDGKEIALSLLFFFFFLTRRDLLEMADQMGRKASGSNC